MCLQVKMGWAQSSSFEMDSLSILEQSGKFSCSAEETKQNKELRTV